MANWYGSQYDCILYYSFVYWVRTMDVFIKVTIACFLSGTIGYLAGIHIYRKRPRFCSLTYYNYHLTANLVCKNIVRKCISNLCEEHCKEKLCNCLSGSMITEDEKLILAEIRSTIRS